MEKNAFDELLKQNMINATGIDFFGYWIANRNYPNYYCADAFANFVHQMRDKYPSHYQKYNSGKGSELKQNGCTPPKMASVGSSSRFCYLALRKGANVFNCSKYVEFEHPCPIDKIKGGTPPQMDAYLKKENIFVEAKCHEIFDSHKIVLSSQYFGHLYGEGNDFGFESIKHNTSKSFEVPVSSFDVKKSPMLDIKQLICHLLGIKSHKKQNEKATLVYLFFKPKVPLKVQQIEIDNLFFDLKTEIETIFNSSPIKNFTKNNNIELMAVAEYAEVMCPLTTNNILYLYP